MPDILPSSIPKRRTTVSSLSAPGTNWVRIYCANCGADGGAILENEYDFAFYLCNDCAASGRIAAMTGLCVMPDEEFNKKLHDAQIEKYGHILTPGEIAVELSDDSSMLSKLAKENPILIRE